MAENKPGLKPPASKALDPSNLGLPDFDLQNQQKSLRYVHTTSQLLGGFNPMLGILESPFLLGLVEVLSK